MIQFIYLFNGHCGEDEFGKRDVYTTLNEYSIYQIDTTIYFIFDNGSKITDSITVSESAIKIDSLGRFIRL